MNDLSPAVEWNCCALASLVGGLSIPYYIQDQRIGKIVGGVGLLGFGIGVAAAALEETRTRVFQPIKSKDAPRLQKSATNRLILGGAALGVICASVGAYQVAMGVKELLSPHVDSAGALVLHAESLTCGRFMKKTSMTSFTNALQCEN